MNPRIKKIAKWLLANRLSYSFLRWFRYRIGTLEFIVARYYKAMKYSESIQEERRLIKLTAKGVINDQVSLDRLAEVDYMIPIFNYYIGLLGRISEWGYHPKISIIIPVYKVNVCYFEQTLKSVVNQIYDNWELCIVDDASEDKDIITLIESFKSQFSEKIKYAIHKNNQHISATSNTALDLATGDYIALLDHDDCIYPNALAEVVRFINYKNKPDILFSDEQVVNKFGDQESAPFFKPDYLPFLHLAVNYTTHFSVYKTRLIKKIGGFRLGYEGSQDFDLMLRAYENTKKPVIHIPMVLYQWRAHEDSTASDINTKNYAITNGLKVVEEALERRGRKGNVFFNKKTLHYDIEYEIKKSDVLVTIIIPNKNSYNLLRRCINSIWDFDAGLSYEIIIVDNQSDKENDNKILNYYLRLEREENIKILKYDKPFNFAAMNNYAVNEAKGDFIILLNNDTEVVTDNWVRKMVSYAQFPEVGSVGAKLLYSNNKVQHGGLMFMDRSIAGHAWVGKKENDNLYFDCLNTSHEVTGVTAACLCIEKKKYLEVGGLDEDTTPNGWGDVEFAVKLNRKGYRSIYNAKVKLYHHESPSRGESLEYFEKWHIIKNYGSEIMNDIFTHPFLHQSSDFSFNENYLSSLMNTRTISFFWENDIRNWNELTYKKYLKV